MPKGTIGHHYIVLRGETLEQSVSGFSNPKGVRTSMGRGGVGLWVVKEVGWLNSKCVGVQSY